LDITLFFLILEKRGEYMTDLKTNYMGIELKNPIIAGASSLTSHMDSIRKVEDAGVGALVIKSLFEEQIQLESYKMKEDLHKDDDLYAEMLSIFPDLEHAGPDDHLHWVRKAKEETSIPVIASLNAVNRQTWIEYAQKLEETGVDGLELNFYRLPIEFDVDARTVEKEQVDAVTEVVQNVDIPVSVKLSPYYTSPLYFIKQLDKVGVKGFVLFNRLFQPSININREENDYSLNLSNSNDYRLALRFSGLLHEQINGSICASNGVNSTENLIKVLLAGADAVQMVSALYSHSIVIVPKILGELKEWMGDKNYSTLKDFRGKLSYAKNSKPEVYTRAQYAKALLHPEKYIQTDK